MVAVNIVVGAWVLCIALRHVNMMMGKHCISMRAQGARARHFLRRRMLPELVVYHIFEYIGHNRLPICALSNEERIHNVVVIQVDALQLIS